MPDDPFDLARFVSAQSPVYETVCAELKAGRKQTHWMWFIFPQVTGLGYSPTAKRYAIQSLEEARSYLQHPVLGARLRECTNLVLAVEGRTASDIVGDPDDAKFKSCLTLFALVAEPDSVFARALKKYFAGEQDIETLQVLKLP